MPRTPLANRRDPTHPMNGATVYTIIGVDSSLLANVFPTIPPATERNALPARPSRKRATNIVRTFRASTHGIVPMINMAREQM